MTGRKPRHLAVQPSEAVHPRQLSLVWPGVCGSAAVSIRVTDLPISLSGGPMYQPAARSLLTNIKSHRGVNMARSHIRLVVPRDQIALGAVGLLVMFAGGWFFWYFAVRPHHPSSYSLFEIAIMPVGLLVIGMLCLLAAAGEFTGTRSR